MFVITKKSLILGISIICTCLILVSFFSSNQRIETTSSMVKSNIIVIDAGHGLPDGGATANGIIESELNLQIAERLENMLIDLGYEVIMTREDENSIADEDKQSSISQTKKSDLENRVNIINESGADFCVSIHLNKYESSKYWGWQTFFSEGSAQGKRLAELIQTSIGDFVEKENKRQALKISNIKIVDKTNIPVVIVECGFISNYEEARLLKDDLYQEKLVNGICDGIEKYYKGI